MSCLLRVQVLYFKCAARVIIIEDFSYMHIIGQHKRLSSGEDPDPACSGTN